jgi:hypothetical protein
MKYRFFFDITHTKKILFVSKSIVFELEYIFCGSLIEFFPGGQSGANISFRWAKVFSTINEVI